MDKSSVYMPIPKERECSLTDVIRKLLHFAVRILFVYFLGLDVFSFLHHS